MNDEPLPSWKRIVLMATFAIILWIFLVACGSVKKTTATSKVDFRGEVYCMAVKTKDRDNKLRWITACTPQKKDCDFAYIKATTQGYWVGIKEASNCIKVRIKPLETLPTQQ